MRNIIQNKKGAVNTYRFIAMYILIGMLVSMMTVFSQDVYEPQIGYELNTQSHLNEVTEKTNEIYSDSETLVQSNQFALTSSFGDEKALGRNWYTIFKSFFLPTGFLSDGYKPSEMEYTINWIVIIFRIIITLFAGYEVFQITIKTKQT